MIESYQFGGLEEEASAGAIPATGDVSNWRGAIPPDDPSHFHQIRKLNLTETEIHEVPDWVAKCSQLQLLGLGHNRITALPYWLSHLTTLKALYLHHNRLRELPSFVGDFQLAAITLGHNLLSSLPELLRRIPTLERLSCDASELTDIPDWLGEIEALRQLELYDNRLTRLPESLGNLSLLEMLELHNNELQRLPHSLAGLRRLRLLTLSDNRLETLPRSLLDFPALEILSLHGNPKLGIPSEILGERRTAILGDSDAQSVRRVRQVLEYYFSTEGEQGRALREVKLILVGRGEVGKSSIADVLQGKRFVKNRKRTEGISISEWPVNLKDGAATILMWDFGGQEIMHGTHQFFLTHRSLYIVMVDGRHDRGKQDAEYWLKLVRAFGGDSPVLVVLNRQKENPFDIDRQYLSDKYDINLGHFFRTECSMPSKVKPVRDAILREATKILATEARFPAKNWSVKTRLAEMKARGEDYLSEEHYITICEAHGVNDPAEQQKLLARLADLGTVVSFPADLKLAELTVLNPEWVTDGMYRVVTNDALREQRHGQLTLAGLRGILPKERWPQTHHLRYLIDLMEKFELCFRVVGEEDTVLVPELLPDETPKFDDWDPARCVVFVYRYNVLPHGILPRFITRTHTLSQGKQRWRTGVVVTDDSAEGLIKADFDVNQITVWIRGAHTDSRRALLKVIRHHFDVIHSRIKDLDPQELVAVPNYPAVTVSFRDLVLDERDGKITTRVTIEGNRIDVPVADMLNGVESLAQRQRSYRKFEEKAALELRFEAGSKVQFGDNFMEQHNKQQIAGGTFNAPVGVNQTFTNCYNTLQQIQSGELRGAIADLVKRVEVMHPNMQDASSKALLERQLKLLTEEAAQPQPNKGQIELSGKGLIEAAKTCAAMAEPVVAATKIVLQLFGVDLA